MPNEDERIIAEDPFNRRLSGVRKARPTQENKANQSQSQSFVGKARPVKQTVEAMLMGENKRDIPIIKDDGDQPAPLAPDIQAQLMALAQMPQSGSRTPQRNPQASTNSINFQHPLNTPQNPLKPELAGKPELLSAADLESEPPPKQQIQSYMRLDVHETAQKPVEEKPAEPTHTVSAAKEAQQDQIEKTYFYDDQIKTIFNFRYAMRQLVKEVKRANRHERPLCVCIAAFHELSVIRNQFGELAGDEAFRVLGQVLIKFIDLDMEIVGRYGDQIIIVLPEFQPPNAAQLLDEVRRTLEATPIQYRHQQFALKASIGIAGLGTHGTTWKDLLVKAEQASMTAIQRGGNTIAFPPRDQ